MKKFFAVFVSIVSLGLSGCGGSDDPGFITEGGATEAGQAEIATQVTLPPEEEVVVPMAENEVELDGATLAVTLINIQDRTVLSVGAGEHPEPFEVTVIVDEASFPGSPIPDSSNFRFDPQLPEGDEIVVQFFRDGTLLEEIELTS